MARSDIPGELVFHDAPEWMRETKLRGETRLRAPAGMVIATVDGEYAGEIVYQDVEPEEWERWRSKFPTRERYFGPPGAGVLYVHWVSVPEEFRRRGHCRQLLGYAMGLTTSDAVAGIPKGRGFVKAAQRLTQETPTRRK